MFKIGLSEHKLDSKIKTNSTSKNLRNVIKIFINS